MNEGVQRLSRLALLLALAVVLHTVEAFIPITVVWFRIGFANIIGIATLYIYGFRDACALTVGRIFLGSLAVGLFASPAFVLSLTGGVFAIVAMGVVHRYGSRVFSVIGVSVVGAIFHNIGQLVAAYLVLIRHEGVFLLLPVMLLTAIATGVINGLAARYFIRRFEAIVSE